MRSFRAAACIAAAGLVLALGACGNDDPAEGLLSNIDKARSARSLSSLQTGLVTLGLVQAEAPAASAQSVAAALQAKDPTNRYTTAAPTDVGIVQVAGGGGGPVMLVSVSSAPSDSRAQAYIGAWQGNGTTMYYAGPQPPGFASSVPSGPGWSATPPQ